MLAVDDLVAGYGGSRVLHGVTFSVGAGEVVTLLGRNGMGKTTTVRAVMGLLAPQGGRITFGGADVTGLPPYRIAQRGIGRALMTNPRLLILDEATEGLAPLIRAEIWAVLARLRAEGLAILLIDKNLAAILRLADRHVVIEKGSVVWTGSSEALSAAPEVRDTYLHV